MLDNSGYIEEEEGEVLEVGYLLEFIIHIGIMYDYYYEAYKGYMKEVREK